jgi:hypothetical protein
VTAPHLPLRYFGGPSTPFPGLTLALTSLYTQACGIGRSRGTILRFCC